MMSDIGKKQWLFIVIRLTVALFFAAW